MSGAKNRGRLPRRLALPAAIVAAAGAGLAGRAAGLPGGAVFGAVLGAALVTAWHREAISIPRPLRMAVMIGVGAQIGMRVTSDTLVALGEAVGPALLAAVLLVLVGFALSAGLRRIGRAPEGDVLATSPGALEVLVGLAAEHDRGPVEVAMFHIVRIFVVVLSVPLLLHLLG